MTEQHTEFLSSSDEPDLAQGVRLGHLAADQIEALAAEFSAESAVLTVAGEDAVFIGLSNSAEQPSKVSLGYRIPLVPPVGAVFVSSLGSVAVNEWLGRLPMIDGHEVDEDTRTAFIRQLERVRERGFSLSIKGVHSETETYEAVREYSTPRRTLEDEARFKSIVRRSANVYEPDLDADRLYDLHSIVVPVEGPFGLVQLAIRLSLLNRELSGREIEWIVARMRLAAEVVSERLAVDHEQRLGDAG